MCPVPSKRPKQISESSACLLKTACRLRIGDLRLTLFFWWPSETAGGSACGSVWHWDQPGGHDWLWWCGVVWWFVLTYVRYDCIIIHRLPVITGSRAKLESLGAKKCVIWYSSCCMLLDRVSSWLNSDITVRCNQCELQKRISDYYIV